MYILSPGSGVIRIFLATMFIKLSWCLAMTPASAKKCPESFSDVVFALDSSGRQGAENFTKQVNFVRDVAERLPIGAGHVQVFFEGYDIRWTYWLWKVSPPIGTPFFGQFFMISLVILEISLACDIPF